MNEHLAMTPWIRSIEREAAWCGRLRTTRWRPFRYEDPLQDATTGIVPDFSDVTRLVPRASMMEAHGR